MTLDATVAGATADSYLTVAAADALAAKDVTDDPEVSAWLVGTPESKEAVLRKATTQLEAAVSSGWLPYTVVQALRFPRSIDYTVNGNVATPYVPLALQRATYEQAKYLLKNAAVISRAHTRQARAMSSASEPNISYTLAQGGSSEISPAALHYLGRFLTTSGSRGLRSVRMSSGSSAPVMGWEIP